MGPGVDRTLTSPTWRFMVLTNQLCNCTYTCTYDHIGALKYKPDFFNGTPFAPSFRGVWGELSSPWFFLLLVGSEPFAGVVLEEIATRCPEILSCHKRIWVWGSGFEALAFELTWGRCACSPILGGLAESFVKKM